MHKKQTRYQGRDWNTARWRMAEAFFAIDGLYDLCLGEDMEGDGEEGDIDSFLLLQAVHSLYETMSAHVALAMADAIPADERTGRFEQLWAAQEAERRLAAIRERLSALAASPCTSTLAGIASLAQALKTCLKKADQ